MTLRRLLAAAAIVHVTVTILLFVAGRAQLAPSLIDRDGILTATSDSVTYEREAMRPGAWRDPAERFHVRLLSPFFRIAAPLRPGILAAEPLNLICYLVIVWLTFAIGQQAFGRRVAVIAAAFVALWPTLVLHTTQLLKDPLFIAATLAFVFVVLTWLTSTYDWPRIVAAGVVVVAASALLHAVRWQFGIVVLALVVFGLVLLIARQISEKRLLPANVACGLIALAAALLMTSQFDRTLTKVKPWPSPTPGQSKKRAPSGKRVTAVVAWVPDADQSGATVGGIRARYNVADSGSRSPIDDRIELRSTREMAAYLPRAMAIGFGAPFPDMWFAHGLTVGRAGRVLAGTETAAMYLFELLALSCVMFPPRRLPAFLLFGVAAFGVTALGMVVSNVGTLYRFRYAFWILLIVAGVAGAEKLARRPFLRLAATCIVVVFCSCARPPRADLVLTNLTGTSVDALYLSPVDVPTWQENVLGGDVLRDGDTVEIRFASVARPRLWDLRADGGGLWAEWMGLDTGRIRRITLRGGKGTAVAELATH